jgi:hypothetical protein
VSTAATIQKANARLANKAPLQIIEYSKVLEKRITEWQQGLPDMLSREFFLLQKQDTVPGPGQ